MYLREEVDNVALYVAKRGKAVVISGEFGVWMWNQGQDRTSPQVFEDFEGIGYICFSIHRERGGWRLAGMHLSGQGSKRVDNIILAQPFFARCQIGLREPGLQKAASGAIRTTGC